MRRILTVMGLTSALVVGASATALAGEVTGTGSPTPIASWQAGSICSFSGLNDNPDDPAFLEGGRVQSFGDILQELVQVTDYRGASTLTGDIASYGPGVECQGQPSD